MIAQLGTPDMRIPSRIAWDWPDRIVGPSAKLDLAKIGQLTFEAPDFERFPALRLAYEALVRARCDHRLQAANEIAVAALRGGTDRIRRHRAARRGDAERLDPRREPLADDLGGRCDCR